MTTHAMSCLTCGGSLDPNDGHCPKCQPNVTPATTHITAESRTSATLDAIPNAPTGKVDKMGVRQRDDESTSWTPRIFASFSAFFTAVLTVAFALAALAGIGFGGWLVFASSPHHAVRAVLGIILILFAGAFEVALAIGVRTFFKRQPSFVPKP